MQIAIWNRSQLENIQILLGRFDVDALHGLPPGVVVQRTGTAHLVLSADWSTESLI